jgi:NADH-quinone oxidoreductase subunit M
LGLKTGVYALVRFVFPQLQEAILRWHEWVAAFAPTGIFYAATLALMQVNLRRLLAFAVISHTRVLVIGTLQSQPDQSAQHAGLFQP